MLVSLVALSFAFIRLNVCRRFATPNFPSTSLRIPSSIRSCFRSSRSNFFIFFCFFIWSSKLRPCYAYCTFFTKFKVLSRSVDFISMNRFRVMPRSLFILLYLRLQVCALVIRLLRQLSLSLRSEALHRWENEQLAARMSRQQSTVLCSPSLVLQKKEDLWVRAPRLPLCSSL